MYESMDFKNDIIHYGVLGMRWGIRRYQPYSVTGGRKSGKTGKEIGAANKAKYQANKELLKKAYQEQKKKAAGSLEKYRAKKLYQLGKSTEKKKYKAAVSANKNISKNIENDRAVKEIESSGRKEQKQYEQNRDKSVKELMNLKYMELDKKRTKERLAKIGAALAGASLLGTAIGGVAISQIQNAARKRREEMSKDIGVFTLDEKTGKTVYKKGDRTISSPSSSSSSSFFNQSVIKDTIMDKTGMSSEYWDELFYNSKKNKW